MSIAHAVVASSIIDDLRQLCESVCQLESQDDPSDPEFEPISELTDEYLADILQQSRELHRRISDGFIVYDEKSFDLNQTQQLKAAVRQLGRVLADVIRDIDGGDCWRQVTAMYGRKLREIRDALQAVAAIQPEPARTENPSVNDSPSNEVARPAAKGKQPRAGGRQRGTMGKPTIEAAIALGEFLLEHLRNGKFPEWKNVPPKNKTTRKNRLCALLGVDSISGSMSVLWNSDSGRNGIPGIATVDEARTQIQLRLEVLRSNVRRQK